MGMNISSGDDSDLNAAINTTPLVDVMLVMLIIFLITVPVVVHTIPVDLPKATNVPTQTKPENIVIAVEPDGQVFWNSARLPDNAALLRKLKEIAVLVPQPEVHIRGDLSARYENVGKVVFACQRASIRKVAFITEPGQSAQ
ncbi:MAG TPA: biopolymer transporter ExbD [Spongiibacteraceae bacterium]|nr:biopolymer transporter ExbD [Spongiibacteraceae bacterium]